METKIRQGVFETNSSSTHSICIAKNQKVNLPKSIHFSSGEFGWDYDELRSTHAKASYLFTGCHQCDFNYYFDLVLKFLKKNNIEVTYDEKCEGYVDHGDQLLDFILAVTENEDRLLSYLFSELSYILTGNDNSETDISINVDYEHDYYFKGN